MPPLKTTLFNLSELIEDHLLRLIPPSSTPYQELFSAARYAIEGPAKRIRPILTLLTCEALGGSKDMALTPACAIEMIHTYSIIHDDLPSMDDDDFRRGKPSLHKAYPEGLAILTGDFLLTYAFETLASSPFLSCEQKLALIQELASSSGGHGMVGGQTLDLQATGKNLSLETLQEIHRLKTGKLILSSILFGGLIAKAPQPVLCHLKTFGSELGLVFQIIDDILDVTASQEKKGKKESVDHKKQKMTYVSIFGLEKAKFIAKEHLEKGLHSLKQIQGSTQVLEELSTHLLYRQL